MPTWVRTKRLWNSSRCIGPVKQVGQGCQVKHFYRQESLESFQQGDRYYLRHRQSGNCLRIDRPLYEIWNALSGQTFDELLAQLPAARTLRQPLLQAVLDVLVRAGLAHTDGDEPIRSTPDSPQEGPLVSVIIVNLNGRPHLQDCLSSVLSQAYTPIEVILVDNGSQDDSVSWVREHFPAVQIVALQDNLGFAAGNNAGIDIARGEYVLILNNDTELAPACVAELVSIAASDARIAAVAAMMKMFYLRGFVNSIGGAVGPIGWGSDAYIGHLDAGQFERTFEVFSACFGAALLRRSVLDEIGLLDAGFGIGYYEDSDWCFRARMAGYKIVAASQAVVYHKFSATMNTLARTFKLKLVVRNRLRFALKNLQWRTLACFGAGHLVDDAYHILAAVWSADWAVVRAYLQGWGEFGRSLPDVLAQRAHVQQMRKKGVSDRQIFAPTRHLPPPQMEGSHPRLFLDDAVRYAESLRTLRIDEHRCPG